MSCPHASQPGPCSQCMDVVPQVVTHADGAVLVDGVRVRKYIPGEKKNPGYARRRGRK